MTATLSPSSSTSTRTTPSRTPAARTTAARTTAARTTAAKHPRPAARSQASTRFTPGRPGRPSSAARWITDGSLAEAPHEGHLPRLVRRVPLDVVAGPPAGLRPSAAVYRLRRLLVAAAFLLVALPALLSVRAGVAWLGGEATAGVTSPAPTVVVAEPGDSYWTLANRLHRGGDIRSTVDALVSANGGGELRPGDRLVLAD